MLYARKCAQRVRPSGVERLRGMGGGMVARSVIGQRAVAIVHRIYWSGFAMRESSGYINMVLVVCTSALHRNAPGLLA